MVPAGKSKIYCRSYEFCRIICPLNKQSKHKQNVGRNFKIQAFEVDINKYSISCNRYVEINKILWNKGDYLISISPFFDRHLVFFSKNQLNINLKAI